MESFLPLKEFIDDDIFYYLMSRVLKKSLIHLQEVGCKHTEGMIFPFMVHIINIFPHLGPCLWSA